jgi:murein DD-endopeptidase MepM/ murein hydrolase activator NlpD
MPHRFFGFSQFFGENKFNYAQFGLTGHNGIDTTFDRGEKIYYVCDGKVYATQTDAENGGYGNTVYQLSNIFKVDGVEFYMKITYGHLESFVGKANQQVKQGDYLGRGDNTGISTGDHMHITVKPMFKQPNQVFMELDEIGYKGAIDHFPFIEEKFAEGYWRYWSTLNPENKNYRTIDEGVIPVDVRYWRYYDPQNPGKRPWHSYVSEKNILWQLGKKGLKAGTDFTDREIRGLVYGGWAYEDIFGKGAIAESTTWMYRKKYN